jgi:hypothetical protein
LPYLHQDINTVEIFLAQPPKMEQIGSDPLSLQSEIINPFAFDIAHYNRLLDENSDRLFVTNTDLQIKILEIGSSEPGGEYQVMFQINLLKKMSDSLFTKLEDFEDYLKVTNSNKTTRIM